MQYNSSITFKTLDCKEVRFVSFLSGGLNTAIVVNPPEGKLSKPTLVDCYKLVNFDMITSYRNTYYILTKLEIPEGQQKY